MQFPCRKQIYLQRLSLGICDKSREVATASTLHLREHSQQSKTSQAGTQQSCGSGKSTSPDAEHHCRLHAMASSLVMPKVSRSRLSKSPSRHRSPQASGTCQCLHLYLMSFSPTGVSMYLELPSERTSPLSWGNRGGMSLHFARKLPDPCHVAEHDSNGTVLLNNHWTTALCAHTTFCSTGVLLLERLASLCRLDIQMTLRRRNSAAKRVSVCLVNRSGKAISLCKRSCQPVASNQHENTSSQRATPQPLPPPTLGPHPRPVLNSIYLLAFR